VKQPKHSIVLFTHQANGNLSQRLLEYIEHGIKVYLFTTDSLKAYETDAWEKAREYELFYSWDKIPTHEDLPENNVQLVDGVVLDQQLYDYLCQKSSFNQEQYSLEHVKPDTHLMIAAGAGTGKTTIMISRLLFLKHTIPALSFANIVMITFTNEAAVQMRQKLTSLLMGYYQVTKDRRYLEWIEEAQRLQISTVHSFAKKFLETAGQELGFPSSFSIRTFQFDKKRIIQKWINEYAQAYPEEFRHFAFIPQHHIVNSVLFVNTVLDNKSISANKIANQLDFGSDKKPFSMLLTYLLYHLQLDLKQIKDQENKWEMTDLIRELERLNSISNIQEKMDIHYLMVDEFQDTDIVQVKFVLWLLDQLDFSLFVVGDEKQSIYRFRGADYTAFSQLEDGINDRNRQVIKKSLVKNYRTTTKLLNQLNPLFEQWGKDVGKFHCSVNDRLEPVSTINESSDVLAQFITWAKLKDILNSLIDQETAILVRSNQDVQQIVTWCNKNGIPCEGAVKGDFYRTTAVRDFYIMIQALINFKEESYFYALHRSPYGANTLSNYEVLHRFNPEKRFVQDLFQSLPDWQKWQEYQNMLLNRPVLNVISRIIEEKNPAEVFARRRFKRMRTSNPQQNLSYHKKEAKALKTEYQLNMDHLIYQLQKTFSDTVMTLNGIEKFLRLHIQTNDEELPQTTSREKRSHRIKCMTVHKAKGLEFDHVIIPTTDHQFLHPAHSQVLVSEDDGHVKVGYQLIVQKLTFKNDYLSLLYSSEKSEIVAEETRLLYVAMTRAKKSLFVKVQDPDAQSMGIRAWRDLLKRREP